MGKRDDEKKPAATGQEQTPQGNQQTPPPESEQPGQPPAEGQQSQTAEADATTIRALHDMIMELGQQFADMAQRMAELESQFVGDVLTGRVAGDAPQIEFNPVWLEGLVFTGARRTSDVGNNHDPFERKARRSDVLKWSVSGDEVIIVLADGSKHRVGL